MTSVARPFLSVIIPAYNEANRLPLTLIDVDRHLSAQPYAYEILVIDDGSSDATAEIARRFSGVIKNLKLINNPENRGKGAAVKIGMLTAKGNWRLQMDADNSNPVPEFHKMMPYFTPEHGFDIVIASRGVKGSKIAPPMPLLRRICEWVLNLKIRLILNSKVKDFLLGFHCFSGESAEKIFSLVRLTSWSYAVESLVLGEKLGFKIKEIPIAASYDAGSRFRMGNYLQIIWETIKIWWWLKRKRYSF